MADRSYFQVRQILLDLYPESSEASFAKYFAMKLTGQANLETYYREKTAMGLQLGLPQEVILETLTEGLPFSDQRLVRVVPPENLGEWFRLVQRIHGPSVPTTRHREDQPPTMSANAGIDQSRRPTKKNGQCNQSQTDIKVPGQCNQSQINQSRGPSSHLKPETPQQSRLFETEVPIHPDSRPLLAFATLEELYQPTRLPFGLKTSPQIYERAMSQVLQRQGLDCVAHYFDDFIIYSNTLEEHQNHLRQFFAFCEAEELQINFAKCEFFKQSIDFLGYTITAAGILKQVHPDGNVYPVEFFSRTLRPHEKNYSISELEFLAIVESVEKFRIYLMGRKFTIFSDHHALQWLKTIKNPSGRLFRWSLRLSSYEYEVRYIKGKQQYEADLLSRNPFCGFLDASLIKTHQPTPSRESSLTIDRNGLHTISRKGVTKIIIPKPLIQQLLQTVHAHYNHPGISQMSRLISTQYYCQGMSKDIKQKVKTCPTCQLTKRPLGPTYGELSQPPEAKEPFDLLSLDTIAGFAKYGNTKIYLHVVVDHFSRYAWTFPSKSTSITTYQQVLKRVLQDGSPKRLLTDRAPAFTSPEFSSFLLNRNIPPLLTTSNNPQANGLCERLNATLTGKLRLLHLENPKIAWTKLVKRVTVIYNKTPHSTTGFPPIYLMFGILPPELSNHSTPYPDIDRARKIAHTRTQNKHLKTKTFMINDTNNHISKKSDSYGLDHGWKVLHLSDYLQDEALTYYFESLCNIEDWGKLKESLIITFQKVKLTPLVEMMRITQEEQETVTQYFHRKMQLTNNVELNLTSIVELLNEGVKTKYKPYLATIDAVQPSEWLTMAIKVENSLTGSGTPVEKGRLQAFNPALHPSPRPAGCYGNSQVQRPPMPCRICERLGLELQWHYHSVCPYRSPTASRSFSSASPHSYQAAASSSFPPPTPHDYQPTVPSASSPDSPRPKILSRATTSNGFSASGKVPMSPYEGVVGFFTD
ncbi:hypothetical protein LAZ67_2005524 [Cordylochernes scorpioides]|uniref:RNA-directed DNA polymerase n=1 Tax=Cordylochernes scorpioides TaxID=51811 RepID=A0ABY6K5F2_9ARAC|nr:hypothetical protein LAZ67_2005524 [Cordylochernes scorpioides]